jgi:hypothetical protein
VNTESDVSGFAFIVKAPSGKQFLHGGTFGKSRKVAKQNLQRINTHRCEQHRPTLEPLALYAVRLELLSIDRVYHEPSDCAEHSND